MNLWWNLTVEWPCALQRWILFYIITPLLARLEQLTFKRVVYLAALTLAIIAFAQIVSIDVAFLWAGDAAFYFEVASAVIFISVRGHIRQLFYVAGQQTRLGISLVTKKWRAARQRRNLNAVQRKSRHRPEADDEPARWNGASAAFA